MTIITHTKRLNLEISLFSQNKYVTLRSFQTCQTYGHCIICVKCAQCYFPYIVTNYFSLKYPGFFLILDPLNLKHTDLSGITLCDIINRLETFSVNISVCN